MKFIRENENKNSNSFDAILASYDLQTGSYINNLRKPTFRKVLNNYTQSLAEILNSLHFNSILEAGVGEGTTLAYLLKKLENQRLLYSGFDISYSRMSYCKRFLHEHSYKQPILFTGNYLFTPIRDNSIDIVYTSHSIEPNRGREKEIILQLYKVARKYLILLEPSNELGNDETKKHIEEHKYCLNLAKHSKELGLNIIEHRLFEYSSNPKNQTALIVIEKKPKRDVEKAPDNVLACPQCKGDLTFHLDNYFCTNCCLIYPVINSIPCLLPENGIRASKFLEKKLARKHYSN